MAKFEKGQSGNPGGRPKGAGPIRNVAQRYGQRAVEVLNEIMEDTEAPRPTRIAAALGLLDRGYGRPAQSIEHSGEVGGQVLFAVAAEPDPKDAAEWLEAHRPK